MVGALGDYGAGLNAVSVVQRMTRRVKWGTLKIDVDRGAGLVPWRKLFHRLYRAGYTLLDYRRVRSRSGAGWHLLLTVTPAPPNATTVVALQLLCGSDPLREACNLHRASRLKGMPAWARNAWNVLYTRSPKNCGRISGRRRRRGGASGKPGAGT